MEKFKDYYVTIGLEIHVTLKTKEKLFSSTVHDFEVENIALFDAGVPGILPILSKEPVGMAIAFGKAVNADVKKESIFERKHYFYPDLPLGYQITQQNNPIIVGGKVVLKDGTIVEIEHAHLECDAAKSIHDIYSEYTVIDLARAAAPLLEIVSTPCIHSPAHAKEYAKSIHALTRFMGICDGKLEEGSFRVDASISLSKTEKLRTRVEIKNISSFSFLETALLYEIERQSELLNDGKSILMETRLFDEKSMSTKSMREKETVAEYRYMPDPDIPHLVLSDELLQESENTYDIKYFLYKEELKSILKIDEVDTHLTGELKNEWILFLKNKSIQTELITKLLSFWYPEVISREKKYKALSLDDLKLLSSLKFQAKETKSLLESWINSNMSLKDLMPKMMTQEDLLIVIQEVLVLYPEQITKYKNGEVKMLQFLIGKVMGQVKGKAMATDVKLGVEGYLTKC